MHQHVIPVDALGILRNVALGQKNNRYLSDEAQEVLDKGKELWTLYFSDMCEKKLRDEYHVTNSSVGWFQVRRILAERYGEDTFEEFNAAYSALTTKLHSQVYEFGFLR